MPSSARMDPESWSPNLTLWLLCTIAALLKRLGLLRFPMSLPLPCHPVELTCKPFRNLRRRRRRTSRCGKSTPVLLFTNSRKRTWLKAIGVWAIHCLRNPKCYAQFMLLVDKLILSTCNGKQRRKISVSIFLR